MKDLNFFAPYQYKNKENVNEKVYIYTALGIVSLFIIITIAFNSIKIIMLNKSIKDFTAKLEVPEIQSQLKEAEKINSQLAALDKYDKSITVISNGVEKRNNVSDDLLQKINSTIPSEVSFKKLTVENNVVTILGVSTNRISVAEFKHNLSELNNIQNVYVNKINNENAVEGEYSFDIKCVLKDVE